MVSFPHPTVTRHDGPRLMHPLLDWGGVAQLMRLAFQSEVTSGSLPLLPDWFWMRWLRPLLGFFEWLGMETPEQMLGYVWEEQHRIVGNVTLGLSHEHAGVWLLSNVAVHPTYRRRGIARTLTELAVNETRRHGGKYLALQVQTDNDAARLLYERLGFRSTERVSEWYGAHTSAPRPGASPFSLVPSSPAQWRAVQAIASEHLPPALRAFRHSQAGTFLAGPGRGMIARLGDLARGVQLRHWSLLQDSRVVGGMLVQASLGWSAHHIHVCVAPSARGQVEPLLLAQAMQSVRGYPSTRLSISALAEYGELRAHLRQAGLREVRTLELMGLAL